MFSDDRKEQIMTLASYPARKIVMALTGQAMLLFVIAHLLGNLTIFFGGLNAYAASLAGMPCIQWPVRIFMSVMLCLHVYFGVLNTLGNRGARSDSYAVGVHLQSTFAGRNMIWTGSIIAAFLVYHLLHFTFQVIYPEFSAVRRVDSYGRPDVFMMVVDGFGHIAVSAAYVTGLAGLGLHLLHGLQSSIQTLGLNNDRTLPVVVKSGATASLAMFLAYSAIPVAIITGTLKR